MERDRIQHGHIHNDIHSAFDLAFYCKLCGAQIGRTRDFQCSVCHYALFEGQNNCNQSTFMCFRCVCSWKPEWLSPASISSGFDEICWIKQEEKERYSRNGPWISIYFGLAAIQCFLIYAQTHIDPMIDKMNEFDRKMINKLVIKYQMTIRAIYESKHKLNQKKLSMLSKGVLPSDIYRLILRFTMKSGKNVIAGIHGINKEKIEMDKRGCFRCYDAISILIITAQITCLSIISLMVLTVLQCILRCFCCDFTFFLIIGAIDRISYYIIMTE